MEKDRYDSAIPLFSLMAHPVRLQIPDVLRRGEACVCHLQAALELPQPYISQQLRVIIRVNPCNPWQKNFVSFVSILCVLCG